MLERLFCCIGLITIEDIKEVFMQEFPNIQPTNTHIYCVEINFYP